MIRDTAINAALNPSNTAVTQNNYGMDQKCFKKIAGWRIFVLDEAPQLTGGFFSEN